jgi:hypothetical protein
MQKGGHEPTFNRHYNATVSKYSQESKTQKWERKTKLTIRGEKQSGPK